MPICRATNWNPDQVRDADAEEIHVIRTLLEVQAEQAEWEARRG
ncbi:MAG: hypothetical protein ACYC9D_00510 [Candidatus Dormibacteria bacterium]